MNGYSFEEYARSKKRPLILDGAIGSILQIESEKSPLWSSLLNITEPEKVIDLHKQYINAGADIITTNTFRTNPSSLANTNLIITDYELVKISVELAIKARENKNILIAGSNAPAEDCYQPERTISQIELEENHRQHINNLWESGVDFILNETFSHLDEIDFVCKHCSQNSIPYIISLYLAENIELLDGSKLSTAIKNILPFKPLAIGINCVSPNTFELIDFGIFKNIGWGFYLNCGSGNVTDEVISCGISPTDYAETAKKYLRYNPIFIGSCCGSSPEHTKFLREAIDEIY